MNHYEITSKNSKTPWRNPSKENPIESQWFSKIPERIPVNPSWRSIPMKSPWNPHEFSIHEPHRWWLARWKLSPVMAEPFRLVKHHTLPIKYHKIPFWLVVWKISYFSIYWECHHPNWCSCFSDGLKPPNSIKLPFQSPSNPNLPVYPIQFSLDHHQITIKSHQIPIKNQHHHLKNGHFSSIDHHRSPWIP